MPEEGVPAPFGALPANFLRGPEKSKKCQNFAYFPWWALAAIHPDNEKSCQAPWLSHHDNEKSCNADFGNLP